MFNLLFSLLFVGCAKQTSSFSPVQPQSASPSVEVENQCGWVSVKETIPIGLFFFKTRQFTEQLYYCCPGEKESPKPMCYQATWVEPK